MAMTIISAVIIITLSILDSYTLHGEEITVPDLSGLPKEDLARVLGGKNLLFNIIDSAYLTDRDKGEVIGQNPPPMSRVKKGRTIYITVSAVTPPSVRLPLMVDKSVRQATYIIRNIGLKLGNLIYKPDQCVNCVLAIVINGHELRGDTLLAKGTEVGLILGGGLSEEKVLVPPLINLRRDEAIERLKSAYLNIGAEVYDETVLDLEDSLAARIYSQSPEYGIKSWLRMGSTVDVEYTTLANKIDSNIVILDSATIQSYVDKDDHD